MIYLIGEAPESVVYQSATFADFKWWLGNLAYGVYKQHCFQLDVETNVTEHWCTKELRTVQIGTMDGQTQWVIQWSALTEAEKDDLKWFLEWERITWVIHNAMFECVVFLFHGVRLHKVYCTMLAEMILWCGIHTQDDDELEDNEAVGDAGFFSLAQTHRRYIGTDISKAEQLNFGDDILTEGKVLYAAGDVKALGWIRRDQLIRLNDEGLMWVASLEMEAVLGYAEMTYHGMELDTDKWLANLELALPVQAEARRKLDEMAIDPKGPFLKRMTELGFTSPHDRLKINWNSHPTKYRIVDRFFPFLKDRCGVPAIRSLVENHDSGRCLQDGRIMEWIRAFHEKDWPKIERAMVETDRQWLIDSELLTPAGMVTINWNSWEQALPVFQAFQPKLKSTSKKDMGMFLHPIATLFKEFKDSMKLSTTYGEKFITEHLEPDGKIRTTINQIVSTGRISSRRPNMQQIPVREPVGNRYINCFVASKGWGYVCSDYIGQELVVIASLSGEKAWLESLKKRQDLHAVCAELISPREWKEAKEEGCDFYRMDEWSELGNKWKSECTAGEWYKDWAPQPRKAKCKCKKHKAIREPVKNLNFGMAYGMSKFKLAGDMKWPIKRAEETITRYFATFPALKKCLNYFAWFGLTEGYIQTIEPFCRKRWFDDASYYSREEIIAHWKDIKFNKRLGQIERAAKNMPIQGSSADCTKLAMVLLYHKIHDERWEDKVYLALQVHDANDTICRDDFSQEWEGILDNTMLQAALFIIPNGLLRAETMRSPVWTK